MPTITIRNLDNKSIIYNDTTQSVLSVLHENNIDWMHACGTKGRCTTCKMIVHTGLDDLTDISEFEKKYKTNGQLKENERLTCQCKALDDIVISVPDSSKLPHINYSA
jgi:2Fe-2S ferredoxin